MKHKILCTSCETYQKPSEAFHRLLSVQIVNGVYVELVMCVECEGLDTLKQVINGG